MERDAFSSMKMFPCLVAAATLLLPVVSHAQNATTTPVGVVTLEVQAKPANSRSFNFVSLPLVRPAVFSGAIPSGGVAAESGSTVLTFPANTFGEANLADSSTPHYLEISTGDHAGITSQILSNTGSTITLADDLSEVLEAGTTPIAIRPNWTLGTAFPNGEGFQKGISPGTSDTIVMFNTENGQMIAHYFDSTANEWRTGLTPANNVVIPPDAGIWIERRSESNGFSIQLTGEVKVNQSAIYVGGNAEIRRTVAPNLYPLDSVSLADSGLYTGNPETGLMAGVSPGSSDYLIIFDPNTGAQTAYFYSSIADEWRRGLTPSNHVKIPAGASIMVVRQNNRKPFIWYIPRPFMALN